MGKPLADDLMVGVELIAKHIGQPQRRTFYMLEKGQLPAFKLGIKWAARQSTLERFITEQEEQAARATSRRTATA